MSEPSSPERHDLRLAGGAVVAWVLAAILVATPVAAPWAVAGTVGSLGVCCALLAGRRTVGGPIAVRIVSSCAVAAGACVLVAVAVLVGHAHRSPAVVSDAVGRTTGLTVTVTRDLAPDDRSVIGHLTRLGDADGLAVPVRVVPDRQARPVAVAAGTVLRGHGAVEPDDAGFPTAAVVFLRGSTEQVSPTGLLAATGAVRQAFAAVTGRLPEPGGALLRGLAVGDRSGLDPDTEAAMETTALTHLTAVSGANCAVVVGLVVLLGRAVGLGRVARAGLAVTFLLVFVVLVRPDPSIVRATVMAVVVLGVRLTGRPVRGVPLIALALIGMLVVDPWYARAPAFVLSVLATSGIVVLAPPLTERLARRVPTPVAAAVAVPVAAQLACWPATVPLAAALPTYAVPANLLTEPLAPIVTVVGLASCLLAPLWPWGSAVLAGVAWAPASAIGAVARGAAVLPAASLPWPPGVAGVVAAGLACGCAAAAVLVERPPGTGVSVVPIHVMSGHRRRWSALGSVPVRQVLLLSAAVVVVVGTAVVSVPALVVRSSLPADWSVAMCDVGQGDAVVLRDAGATAVVDTGDDEEALERCLALLGVDRVDLLVLTHFDRDHVGAVGVVAARTTTALVGPTGRPEDRAVVQALVHAGVDVRRADDRTAGVLGAQRWRVLWPRAGDDASGNDASLVLRTEGGCASCLSGLFLGDLGEGGQRRLRASGHALDAAGAGAGAGVSAGASAGAGVGPVGVGHVEVRPVNVGPGDVGPADVGQGDVGPVDVGPVAVGPVDVGPVDVVKVSHHGSADQDPQLYRQAAATVGLIGVGNDNTYGHPTPSALDMLAAAGTTPYRTDQRGTIVLGRDPGGGLRVWTERPGSEVARRIEACPPRSPLGPPRRSTRCRGRASGRRPSC